VPKPEPVQVKPSAPPHEPSGETAGPVTVVQEPKA
jgi:hypothetical protein